GGVRGGKGGTDRGVLAGGRPAGGSGRAGSRGPAHAEGFSQARSDLQRDRIEDSRVVTAPGTAAPRWGRLHSQPVRITRKPSAVAARTSPPSAATSGIRSPRRSPSSKSDARWTASSVLSPWRSTTARERRTTSSVTGTRRYAVHSVPKRRRTRARSAGVNEPSRPRRVNAE